MMINLSFNISVKGKNNKTIFVQLILNCIPFELNHLWLGKVTDTVILSELTPEGYCVLQKPTA